MRSISPESLRRNDIGSLYVFPCGMFEDGWAGQWDVMLYSPMPCTPAGHTVVRKPTKQEAYDYIDHLAKAHGYEGRFFHAPSNSPINTAK